MHKCRLYINNSHLQVVNAEFTVEALMVLPHVVLELVEVPECWSVVTGLTTVLQEGVICLHHTLILEEDCIASFIQHVARPDISKCSHCPRKHHL